MENDFESNKPHVNTYMNVMSSINFCRSLIVLSFGDRILKPLLTFKPVSTGL